MHKFILYKHLEIKVLKFTKSKMSQANEINEG